MVARAERLGRIFDERHTVSCAGVGNRRQIDRKAEHVRDQHGLRLRHPECRASFEFVHDQLRIDVPRGQLSVYERRPCPEVGDRIDRRDEREVRHQHVIAGTHASDLQRDMYGRRPAGTRHGVWCADLRGECRFKS